MSNWFGGIEYDHWSFGRNWVALDLFCLGEFLDPFEHVFPIEFHCYVSLQEGTRPRSKDPFLRNQEFILFMSNVTRVFNISSTGAWVDGVMSTHETKTNPGYSVHRAWKKQNMCFEESLFVFRKSFFQNVYVFSYTYIETLIFNKPITDHRPKQSHGHPTLSPNDPWEHHTQPKFDSSKTTGCMLPQNNGQPHPPDVS